MDSQTREEAARQLRLWATSRFLPNDQVEQMVSAVRSGLHDDQIMQARNTASEGQSGFAGRGQRQQQHDQQQQKNRYQHPLLNPVQLPPFNSHPPFNGFFPTPTMPAIPTMPPPMQNPTPYPPPPTSIPVMFPTAVLQTKPMPNHQSTQTTTFPGGESTQHTSSYSGKQGNTTFQYSSSSTSVNVTSGAYIPSTRQPGFFAIAHSAPPLMAPVPVLRQQTPQHQHHRHQQTTTQSQCPQQSHTRPQDSEFVQQTPIHNAASVAPPTVETLFNPVMDGAIEQEPQNPRLAEKFRQQLEADEATYFSPIPGSADRRVRR